MKTIKLGFLAIAGLALLSTSCRKEGCTDSGAFNYDEEAKKDDQSCDYGNNATIKFTQSWDDDNVTSADFNDIKFTNANGEMMSIERLRYAISDVRFYKADGDSVVIDMHHLVDLADDATLTRVLSEKLEAITYTGIGFNFGLAPEKNVSASIVEWNPIGWGWPDPIGGGYHQMQFDGKFIDAANDTTGFNFHNGSASIDGMDPGEKVINYIFVKLDKSIPMTSAKTIEIDMQIGEWFKNPNLWDLNAIHSMIMPNQAAQIQISENGKSVFRLGEIN